MLFRKDIQPSCGYCKYGTAIGEGQIACLKRGILSIEDYCRRFRYDPYKREPIRQASFSADNYNQSTFDLSTKE